VRLAGFLGNVDSRGGETCWDTSQPRCRLACGNLTWCSLGQVCDPVKSPSRLPSRRPRHVRQQALHCHPVKKTCFDCNPLGPQDRPLLARDGTARPQARQIATALIVAPEVDPAAAVRKSDAAQAERSATGTAREGRIPSGRSPNSAAGMNGGMNGGYREHHPYEEPVSKLSGGERPLWGRFPAAPDA
jgi:hypothetical protein